MSWASGNARTAWLALALALLGASACRKQEPPRATAIGEGYVAPETLNLRKEIPLNSGTVATANRGERVEILQRRRRFVKVRTASNQEGWTEQSQLLTPEVYAQIAQMAKDAAGLPSWGTFRARDKLNLHMEPFRSSPSIHQLKEEESVALIGRHVSERGAPAPGKPPQFEEWYLVRTAGGQAGWALARMLDAGIPDEVAQYAEGRRIDSYFALGEVVDASQTKKIWLWTTSERGNEPYDFDSFRVFNWGRRKHRYETAHIERRLIGYFPVLVIPHVETRYGSGPGFSLIIEKKDGRRYRRYYVMVGHVVRLYKEEPTPVATPPALAAEPSPPPKPPESPGLLRHLWNWLRRR